MKYCPKFALLGLSLALGACSTTLQGDKINYRSAGGQTSGLEVPPDLTQLSQASPYKMDDAAVTASDYQQQAAAVAAVPIAATELGDVRIQRLGNTRWLTVQRSADKLWQPIKDFWQNNGFVLTLDQANLGIMETDWAENRAKIPQDFIRSALGSVFDSLYSTSERDKFRTRLEQNPDGSTDIFISHRGMVEVYDGKNKDRTVWQPRSSDPELEAEFLRRLMVSLGLKSQQEQAQTQAPTNSTSVQSSAEQSSAQIMLVNGRPVLQLAQDFNQAWPLVGQALDRNGYSVTNRDRSQGMYIVNSSQPRADMATTKPGLLSRLFGRSSQSQKGPQQQFRVVVQSQDNTSTVSVQNADGSQASGADAETIVKLLAKDL